jgi:hypothetical protein
MSADQGNLPLPRTPVREAGQLPLISDPFSAGSTLTNLSSLLDSSGNSSSPSRSWPLRMNLKVDTTPTKNEKRVDLDENTPLAVIRRRTDVGEGDPLKHLLLSPQKALPAKMTLVPDTSPTRLHFPIASLAAGPAGSPRIDSDASSSSSEQEIWIQDPGASACQVSSHIYQLHPDSELDLEWPQDELDDLMDCLKEEGMLRFVDTIYSNRNTGLVKCHEEYVIEKGYSLPKMLSAFGKKVKVSIHGFNTLPLIQ